MFREKRLLIHRKTGTIAIAEIKIWSVPKSKDCPEGRKFSLFLVLEGAILVGMDNHKPKGPHLHLGNQEVPYLYRDEKTLLRDFWELAGKAGYEP